MNNLLTNLLTTQKPIVNSELLLEFRIFML